MGPIPRTRNSSTTMNPSGPAVCYHTGNPTIPAVYSHYPLHTTTRVHRQSCRLLAVLFCFRRHDDRLTQRAVQHGDHNRDHLTVETPHAVRHGDNSHGPHPTPETQEAVRQAITAMERLTLRRVLLLRRHGDSRTQHAVDEAGSLHPKPPIPCGIIWIPPSKYANSMRDYMEQWMRSNLLPISQPIHPSIAQTSNFHILMDVIIYRSGTHWIHQHPDTLIR